MTSRVSPKQAVNGARERPGGAFSDKRGPEGHGAGSCASCLGPIGRKRRGKRFCSDRCRLLFWAVLRIQKALAAGEVDGLRAEIRKLGEGDV